MDFLWKKVSDKEREEIRKEAEIIMSNFSKKLESVKENVGEFSVSLMSKGNFERPEGLGVPAEIDRKIMFENAPNKNEDSIIAEKGEW